MVMSSDTFAVLLATLASAASLYTIADDIFVAKHRAMLPDWVPLPPPRAYTTAELAARKHSLAIAGKVYDVSDASGVYGESGFYRELACRDATRIFATGKRVGFHLDTNLPDELEDASDLSGASVEELRKVCYYVKFFQTKYLQIGVHAPARFYDAGRAATPNRQTLEDTCAGFTDLEDPHGGGIDGEDEVFPSHEEEDGITNSEKQKPSRCPVTNVRRVVAKAIEKANDLFQRLLPAPAAPTPAE